MTLETTFAPLNADPAGIMAVTTLWNAANPQGLAIPSRLAGYNLNAAAGAETAGRLVRVNDRPVGFILASATTRAIDDIAHPSGWIDALAVLPDAQRQGIGSRLIDWAESWLREHGCATARLGGGLRPFAPGLPVETDSAAFFQKRGYLPRSQESRVWDVARRLEDYGIIPAPPSKTGFVEKGEARPLTAVDVENLDAFLTSEFPGRWRYEFREHLRLGGRLADYLLLWRAQEIEGFCQVTLEDSVRPIERFYLHSLPHPWGQLGPIGIGASCRGQGQGAALLDAGLRFLQARGVSGCVIDWTSLPGFYQKFGFEIYREYLILIKELY